MGQAKNRGTFDQRKAEAIAREGERRRKKKETHSGFAKPKRSAMSALAIIAGIAAMAETATPSRRIR